MKYCLRFSIDVRPEQLIDYNAISVLIINSSKPNCIISVAKCNVPSVPVPWDEAPCRMKWVFLFQTHLF